MPVSPLKVLDIVAIAAYVAVALGLTWWIRRRRGDAGGVTGSGRVHPWLAGAGFVAVNVGALEVIGMGGAGAKYGIAAAHFYWIGAIPALVVVALVLMPFYEGGRARSMPEYLALRFDGKTRTVHQVMSAALMVLVTGASLHVMGRLLQLVMGWGVGAGLLAATGILVVFVMLRGFARTIPHELLSLGVIVIGLAPLVFLGLRAAGSWSYLQLRLSQAAINSQLPPAYYTHVWKGMGHPLTNPIGVEWFGLVMGLGVVLSFGYWCADPRVTTLAASGTSAPPSRHPPLLAALVRLFLPALVIVPGLIALIVGGGESGMPYGGMGQGLIPAKRGADGIALIDTMGRTVLDFDLATPMLLLSVVPAGLLGLVVAALLSSFVTGMASGIHAVGRVWLPDAGAPSFPRFGRLVPFGVVALSAAAAYLAGAYNNVIEFLQLVFAFVSAPLLAVVVLGIFWRRATGHGAFAGLLAGTLGAAVHHGISLARGVRPGIKGGYLAPLLSYPSELGQTFWTAIVAFMTSLVVVVIVSILSRPRPSETLEGLVFSLTRRPVDAPTAWWRRPGALAAVVVIAAVVLNVVFY